MIITLTFNPSIDYILQVPEIRMEDTLRAREAYYQPGGKGIHVSRMLTRLGVENTAWAFCGGETGNWLLSYLDEERIQHDFIRTAGQTRINMILTETATHKQLRVSSPGDPVTNTEQHILLDRIRNLPGNTCWLVLGGSLPAGISPDFVREVIQTAKAQDVCCVLDADGDVLKQGLQAGPDLIKPNQYELERLVGHPVRTVEETVAASRQVIEQYGVRFVVTSAAEAGAVLVSREAVYSGKAPKVDVISKVGAGDCMVAGLVKGLSEKVSPDEMLRMGIASGTSAVLMPPDELGQRIDYDALLSQVDIIPLASLVGA